jgi:hypothetical protein
MFFYKFLNKSIFILITLCLSYISNGQNADRQYEYLDSKYGKNQQLFQGELYISGKRVDFGSPFLISEKPHNLKIYYGNVEYRGLLANYDLNKQEVVLTYNTNLNIKRQIILNTKAIDSFNINGKTFIKDTFNLSQVNFLEKAGEGVGLKCYLTYYKYYGFENKGNDSGFGYSKLITKKYLLVDNKLLLFKSKRNFLNLIPQDIRAAALQYIKKNPVRFKNWDCNLYNDFFKYLNTLKL